MQSLEIPLLNLGFIFIPVAVVIGFMAAWSMNWKNAIYGLFRMLSQLLLIGYVLTFVFTSTNVYLIVLILTLMIFISNWISLGPVKEHRRHLFWSGFVATTVACLLILMIVIHLVLQVSPWYQPQYVIPLAGMIFANSMNIKSIAAERMISEFRHGCDYLEARKTAIQAAMIPNINSLFAVGVVSLPGMMTGQILSGVSPLIAVRYQIMVMCMIFASAGISAFIFLVMNKNFFTELADKRG